ncbi:MAG: alpha/beta hydrolase-fold protein [Candidatus Pseudobacter hemicellulosilyticus]|uniref:Alpha/beta hydrolase-fold protein n=1 Tax=Candidatus Pseudobacter hemicellulosilyticus TaxID=3121375 RepID=A0AAJ6BFJ3_9BACT|nr:MAG: alpha/beta hydrolase-fold protein [Pseudobacter sp.]
MHTDTSTGVLVETVMLPSDALERIVKVQFYLPLNIPDPGSLKLLLFNDGQDLETMGFERMLSNGLQEGRLQPVLVAGICSGEDRLQEYGMICGPDYKGRGARAGQYQQFILEELLPYIYGHYRISEFAERAFAGFSLGGLSALDLVWNNPRVFSRVGVFSGSLWWRSKDKYTKGYNEWRDRMMLAQLRAGQFQPGLKFFFQCGELDEWEDRNRNGVIDSIDDTIDTMRALLAKGYLERKDMRYYQMPDGRHDVASWAKAMPVFLRWGWRK